MSGFKKLKELLSKKFKSEIMLAEIKYQHLFFFLQRLEEDTMSIYFSNEFINNCKTIKELIEDYNNPIPKKIKFPINTPDKLFTFLRDKIGGKDKEFIIALATNSKNIVVAQKIIQEGTVNYCHIYPREVVKFILENNGTGLILAHNHPSGKCEPSPDDINLTNKIEKTLKPLEISLLDHMIITQDNGFSIKSNRLVIE